jgi:type IV pilus assembly protein PilF
MKKIIFLLLGCSLLALSGCASTYNSNNTQPSQKLKHNPKAARINVELGLAYIERRDLPRAKTKLMMALKQDANSPVVLDAMAYYQEITQNYVSAEQYYRRAVKLAGNKGAPLNNYGAFLCRRNQYKKAEIYFMKAVKDQSYINSADAYENAGLCALAVPNVADAKTYFRKALALNSMRTTSLYELARLSYQDKHYKQANRYIQRLVGLSKPDASSTLLAYRIATKLKNKTQAKKFADILKRDFPQSKQAQLLPNVGQA